MTTTSAQPQPVANSTRNTVHTAGCEAAYARLFTVSLSGLSASQSFALGAVGRADTLGEAAAELGVAPASLRARLRSIASRLGLPGVGELVTLARRHETLRSGSAAVCGVDLGGRCLFASNRFADLVGYGIEQIVGQDLHRLVHARRADDQDRDDNDCLVQQAVGRAEALHRVEEALLHSDGTALWVSVTVEPVSFDGLAIGAVITVEDLSAVEQLTRRAERAQAHVQLALEASDSMAFEIDLVSGVCTSTGTGGTVLAHSQMAALVVADQREEFDLDSLRSLPPGRLTQEELELVGGDGRHHRYRAWFRLLSDREGRPCCLVGVARQLRAGEDLPATAGDGAFSWPTDASLVVHYQPIIRLADNVTVGVEALARWHHPVEGITSPEPVITAAEAVGMVSEVDFAVLLEACTEVAGWNRRRRQASLRPLQLFVNISATELAGEQLQAQVRESLGRSGLAATCLSLEITETAPISDWDEAERAARQLRAMGVGLTIDDFGTGYSNLERLTRLPVTALKLPRGLVTSMCCAPAGPIGAVLVLAGQLSLTTVAEGVEDQAQARLLRQMGWELAQGHLWSPALPASELISQLAPGPERADRASDG